MAGARKLAEDGVMQVADVPPPHVYPGDDGHRRDDGEHLQRSQQGSSTIQVKRRHIPSPSSGHSRTRRTHRHGPDGHGVVLERVAEARHRVFPDEPVEGLDGVERAVEGGEDGQHGPVEQVQPRDPGPVGPEVEARRSRTGGGHRRRRRHLAAGQPTAVRERTGVGSKPSTCAQVSGQAMDGMEGIANAKCRECLQLQESTQRLAHSEVLIRSSNCPEAQVGGVCWNGRVTRSRISATCSSQLSGEAGGHFFM